MPFDASAITSGPSCVLDGPDVLVTWTSSAPDGQAFQVYVNRRLAWSGTATYCVLPYGMDFSRVQVGAVGPGEADVDFSSGLPLAQGSGGFALLTWDGGTWEERSPPGSGMSGFRVYGEAGPGAGIDYSAPLADIPISAPNLPYGGYGVGPYGVGAYGLGGGRYHWQSDALAGGTWHFAVTAYDVAGNESVVATASQVILGPPAPPARDPGTHLRLSLAYHEATATATLSWRASPG